MFNLYQDITSNHENQMRNEDPVKNLKTFDKNQKFDENLYSASEVIDDFSNQFNCQNCDMKFSSQHGLNIHQTLVHEVEKTLSCKFCDKKFKSFQTLKTHENRHTGNGMNTFSYASKLSVEIFNFSLDHIRIQ